MSAESVTQKWLRQNTGSYPHNDRVYVDIDDALSRFPTLRPKSDVYIYDDGRTQLLLCVHGLLPISFKGTSYNIPISVWLTKEYPRHPPITYVVPTQDMLVRPSKHVDVSGRCNIEYVQHWQRKSEACNISALLEAMQDQFSRTPPLYAKPKSSSPRPAPQPAAPSSSSLSPPPLPASLPASQSPYLSQSQQDDPPALPPKPNASPTPVVPLRPIATPTLSNHASPQADLYNRPPPPLPQPARADSRPPQYQQSLVQPIQGTHAHDGNEMRSAFGQSRETSSPINGNYRRSIPLEALPAGTPYANVPSPLAHVRPPVPAPALTHQTAPHPPQLWSPPLAAPKSDIPPPNLLDEESTESHVPQLPTGPAPPRPPNPELLQLHTQVHDKIRSEFASLSQVMLLDAERLRSQQSDLLAGEPAIRDEIGRLEAVRDVCRNVSARLRNTVGQAERNLTELRRKGDPEVDELVCSTSIVHNQLINLVAEDNAIEDTIYHLHRALNAGRVDLERFLRTTRVLAEEQFMKRALIEKIQQGIPMGMTLPYA
ncbi:UEV domain-containing protein [Melanogaster broomeanus]|nr:UEV domain-containing protein [Melanogaster broomeanus]